MTTSHTGDDAIETAALLRAARADWVDFVFIPNPKPFVVYGDHDEFTTILAHPVEPSPRDDPAGPREVQARGRVRVVTRGRTFSRNRDGALSS